MKPEKKPPKTQKNTWAKANVWALCLVLTGTSCKNKSYDDTPEGVAREFLERMDRMQGDPGDARKTFDLLSQSSQTNLSARARRASAAMGRRLGPESMLVPSHFYPRFQPRQWVVKGGKPRATVEITGVEPATERASITCVLEDSGWRIDLEFPQLPAMEKRKEGNLQHELPSLQKKMPT